MAAHRSFLKGQAFLALIFLIGGVIAAVGLTLAFVGASVVDTGYGYQASAQAEVVATSGAEDGLLQLERNANYTTGSYTLPVGSSTASVTITQNAPSAGFVNILSIATISNRTKKVNVVTAVSTTTNQISVVSWQDVQ